MSVVHIDDRAGIDIIRRLIETPEGIRYLQQLLESLLGDDLRVLSNTPNIKDVVVTLQDGVIRVVPAV